MSGKSGEAQPEGGYRVYLLIDLLRADLGGKRGPGAAGKHDRGHQRAELASDAQCDGSGDQMQSANFSKLIGALQGQNQTDEKRDQGNDGKSFHADAHGLVDGRTEAKLAAAEGIDKDSANRAARQSRQAAYIGKTVNRGCADSFCERHH